VDASSGLPPDTEARRRLWKHCCGESSALGGIFIGSSFSVAVEYREGVEGNCLVV